MKAKGFTKSGRWYTSKEVERKRKGKGRDGDQMMELDQEALG